MALMDGAILVTTLDAKDGAFARAPHGGNVCSSKIFSYSITDPRSIERTMACHSLHFSMWDVNQLHLNHTTGLYDEGTVFERNILFLSSPIGGIIHPGWPKQRIPGPCYVTY